MHKNQGMPAQIVVHAVRESACPADDLAGMPEFIRVQARLMEMTTVGETQHTLEKKGYQVHKLPVGWTDLFPPFVSEELNTEKRFFMPMDHADLSVMYLPAERGLFFHEPYYQEHQNLLDRIVEQVRPDIFGVLPEEDGLPINSLPLPDGGVYMDRAAQKSARILAEAGIRVNTTSKPFGSWAWGTQGGIHCSTNLINLPEADLPADIF